MNQYFGWVEGSKMPSYYTHLAGRDVEDDILRINGIKTENEENKREFVPKKCYRCKEMNPPLGKFCIRCGTPLDVTTIIKIDEKRTEMDNLMTALLKDPIIKDVIIKRTREMHL